MNVQQKPFRRQRAEPSVSNTKREYLTRDRAMHPPVYHRL